MKSKPLVLLLVAAGCGLVAMIGVQQMLSGDKQAAPKVQIVVAKTEIKAGIKLDTTNVILKEWPQDNVPEGAITSEEQFAERALKHQVGPGQPILLNELGNKGEYGLDIHIPPDMRVVSVAVNATMTHSGLLKPGNFVDVYAAVEIPQAKGWLETNRSQVGAAVHSGVCDRQQHRRIGRIQRCQTERCQERLVSCLSTTGMLLQLAEKQSNGGSSIRRCDPALTRMSSTPAIWMMNR